MQVPHNKEVANHVVPESCVARREVRGEALTGVRIGQPLSHDSCIVPGADAVQVAEGNTSKRATASAWMTRRGRRTWHVRTLFVREPGDLQLDRRRLCRWAARIGKARRHKPMMHGLEKSDLAIVAMKPANNAVQTAAEWVGPRAVD